MKKRWMVTMVVILMLFILGACGKEKKEADKQEKSTKNTEIYNLIKEEYGICDSTLQGKYTSTVKREMNRTTRESEIIQLDSKCKSGAVFYKIVNDNNDIVCVYLDDKNDYVNLKLDYIKLNKEGKIASKHTIDIGTIQMKSRSYCLVNSKYVTIVELSEVTRGFYDGYLYLARDKDENNWSECSGEGYYYEEKITSYSLNSELEEVLKVERKITPVSLGTKMCEITYKDQHFKYISGMNYISDDEGLLNTEKEFCDKANELLDKLGVKELKLTRTSWKNRWYRLEIDEEAIPEKMVKVDFTCSSGIQDGNYSVNSDVVITKNAEKEKHGELEEEEPDIPVIYGQSNEEKTEEVIMPDNIPEGIDSSQLQNLEHFKLKGFWYSSDMKYVMFIDTDKPSWSPWRYLKDGTKKVKHGTIKKTSSYSLELNAHEDAEKDFEVFAVNGQLVSDEITFIKVPDNISYNLMGSWQSDEKIYSFDDDGRYRVQGGKGKSYVGYYFVLNESQIILGTYSSNRKESNYSFITFDYTCDGDSFEISGFDSLHR